MLKLSSIESLTRIKSKKADMAIRIDSIIAPYLNTSPLVVSSCEIPVNPISTKIMELKTKASLSSDDAASHAHCAY